MGALAAVLLALAACHAASIAPGEEGTPDAAATEARNSDGSPKRLPYPPGPTLAGTTVLAYADFGPPSLSFGLLGPEWWSWAQGGSWESTDEFDVRVVVYRGLSPVTVRKAFPVVRDASDYRLVAYDTALQYLDATMQDVREPIRTTLLQTRQRIVSALATPARNPQERAATSEPAPARR